MEVIDRFFSKKFLEAKNNKDKNVSDGENSTCGNKALILIV